MSFPPSPSSGYSAPPPSLPPGWTAHVDATSGQTYYHHSPSATSQWHLPTAPLPHPPAAARDRPFWQRDPSLVPSPPAYFTQTPASSQHARMVLQQYALCPRAGYDVVAVTELCNPDLTSAFESRLRQLQSRAGKPAFAPRFASEAEAQQRGAVIDVLRAHAAPFHDVSYPDVTILAAWHGTDSSILPSIMSASFANLASTDSGFFGPSACMRPLLRNAHNARR